MKTVLIVEDNELNMDMLARRLSRRKYRILRAADGKEGLTAARKELPDLIIMDLSLPEIDGWELTRLLKADAKTEAIPIIALTAHAMAGDREKALAAGCDEYRTKPVDLEDLLAGMERLLGER